MTLLAYLIRRREAAVLDVAVAVLAVAFLVDMAQRALLGGG